MQVPWVAVAESKRTLDRIIREDLGFTDAVMKFAVRQFLDKAISTDEKTATYKLKRLASDARTHALKRIGAEIDALVADMSVVEPNKPVVAKTLAVIRSSR